MDPFLSDLHHSPSQLTSFPTFSPSNSPSASSHISALNPQFFDEQPVSPNPFNHDHQIQPHPHPQPQSQPQAQPHLQSQVQPQPQTPPSQTALVLGQASSNPPSYTEMICGAIAAMNEPDGSSKSAILSYIEKSNTNLPPAHKDLMTHHLKSLKNCGILTMVRKSYKLAGSSRPRSVVLALAAPRSDLPLAIDSSVPVVVSASGLAYQPKKRGHGRPPKSKPEAPQQQQPINVQLTSQQQSNNVMSNDLPSREQPQLPVTNLIQEVTQVAKRGPGRPRKDGSAPIPRASAMRQVSSSITSGPKRRGRPRRVESGRVLTPAQVASSAPVAPIADVAPAADVAPISLVAPVAPDVGQTVVVTPGIKHGREQPPKIGGDVMNNIITQPEQVCESPLGRPKKNPTWPVMGATGTLEAAYGELKRKLDLASEKAKEILNVLKEGLQTCDVPTLAQAKKELEGLIPMLTMEPQVIEEEKVEEAAPQTETETQGEKNGQERDGGGEQAQPQPQTEDEAMQEAMF